MSNLLQVSMPQVWEDNLGSELIKRLENRNISVEILTHGQDRPPGKNAAAIWPVSYTHLTLPTKLAV